MVKAFSVGSFFQIDSFSISCYKGKKSSRPVETAAKYYTIICRNVK